MNKKYLKVPYGIQYISEWENYNIPKGHVIIDKGVTGCGYTEYCLTNKDNIVLCSPRKLLLENKRDQHKTDLNILYLENDVEKYQDIGPMKDRIKDHIFNCQGPFGDLPIKLLITYDSCHYIVEVLKELGLLESFIFVVDEFQSIFLDSYYKSSVEFDFVEVLQNCPNVLYLSATPMLDKYLEKLNEFKDLDFYKLDWSETGYVENVRIQRGRCTSLGTECGKIINEYLNGKFPMTLLDSSGKPVESKEAVFYFNSVSDIIRVVKKYGLTPNNTLIICSGTKENQDKLKKIGFQVGKVPLKGESNPMFMFCTSSVYIGVDFYSSCAKSWIFADPNIDSLALDISLDLPQIIGRQRDKSNPFKNDIVIFYRTNRKPLTREDFDLAQEQRRKETNILLDLYNTATQEQRTPYVKKLRADIQVSQYSGDFVSISSKTGIPVYNPFIELANERAWEVSQEDYQDSLTVTRAIQNKGFIDNIYQSRDSIIAQDFLDNYFYQTGIFEEKMKMYCEFMDIYGNNKEILEILFHKIPDQRFKNYYEYFGTSGCKANKFRSLELEKNWRNVTKEDKLISIIHLKFKEGDRYSKQEIKSLLSSIYSSLGITKTPKATDLEEYFKLSKTCITDPVTKKQLNGFKLGKKL